MTLPGDTLEELDALVRRYNKALLDEKAAAALKKIATDDMLNILHQHHCSFIEAGGSTLTVKPLTRHSIVFDQVAKLLSSEQLAQATKISTGISLDVRPLREH